ncbi:hypothetical protein Asera_66000 [Actinocatenispora sera]|uniref:Uncharacterized protein n=1 Tax=Actinocatenispora sera TaxID=390989 RepID=A0A810LD66_9ACTN|nr:hypothetical protein Asera_66000 [Actinocatenispora sera]
MRLSAISLAGTARTLVAVGMVSDASMLLTILAATPRIVLLVAPSAGFGAAGAGFAAAGFGAAGAAGALVAGFTGAAGALVAGFASAGARLVGALAVALPAAVPLLPAGAVVLASLPEAELLAVLPVSAAGL